MDLLRLWDEYPSYLSAARQAGLEDGFNACFFASMLMFVILLSFFGYSRKHIFFIGMAYLYAGISIQQSMNIGVWDWLLIKSEAQGSIDVIYLVVAFSFFMLSLRGLRDWWRYRWHGDVSGGRIVIRAFSNRFESGTPQPFVNTVLEMAGVVLAAFFCGAFFTLIAGIHPQSEFIYVVHSFGASGGDRELVAGMFLFYTLSMFFPLVLLWIFLFLVYPVLKRSAGVLAVSKGLWAMLFCSVGSGLVYFVIQNVRGLLN